MICVRDTTREIKGSKREKEKEKGKEYLIDTFLKHKVEESLAIAFCFLCVFTKGNHCFHPLSCVGGGGWWGSEKGTAYKPRHSKTFYFVLVDLNIISY